MQRHHPYGGYDTDSGRGAGGRPFRGGPRGGAGFGPGAGRGRGGGPGGPPFHGNAASGPSSQPGPSNFANGGGPGPIRGGGSSGAPGRGRFDGQGQAGARPVPQIQRVGPSLQAQSQAQGRGQAPTQNQYRGGPPAGAGPPGYTPSQASSQAPGYNPPPGQRPPAGGMHPYNQSSGPTPSTSGSQKFNQNDYESENNKIQARIQKERPCRVLFVRNVKYDTNTSQLRQMFADFGEMKSFFDLVGQRGLIFITYYDLRDAVRARDEMQGYKVDGRPIDVHYSLPRDDENPDRPCDRDRNQGTLKIVLRDSRNPIREVELDRMFSGFGAIKGIYHTGGDPSRERLLEFFDTRATSDAFDRLQGAPYSGGGRLEVMFDWDIKDLPMDPPPVPPPSNAEHSFQPQPPPGPSRQGGGLPPAPDRMPFPPRAGPPAAQQGSPAYPLAYSSTQTIHSQPHAQPSRGGPAPPQRTMQGSPPPSNPSGYPSQADHQGRDYGHPSNGYRGPSSPPPSQPYRPQPDPRNQNFRPPDLRQSQDRPPGPPVPFAPGYQVPPFPQAPPAEVHRAPGPAPARFEQHNDGYAPRGPVQPPRDTPYSGDYPPRPPMPPGPPQPPVPAADRPQQELSSLLASLGPLPGPSQPLQGSAYPPRLENDLPPSLNPPTYPPPPSTPSQHPSQGYGAPSSQNAYGDHRREPYGSTPASSYPSAAQSPGNDRAYPSHTAAYPSPQDLARHRAGSNQHQNFVPGPPLPPPPPSQGQTYPGKTYGAGANGHSFSPPPPPSAHFPTPTFVNQGPTQPAPSFGSSQASSETDSAPQNQVNALLAMLKAQQGQ